MEKRSAEEAREAAEFEAREDAERAVEGVEALIAAVRAAGDQFKYFHLSPCGACGHPVWQQPCPVCGFYPMGRPTDAELAEGKRCSDPERYERSLAHWGGVAAGYFTGYRRTVGYAEGGQFKRRIDALIVRAKAGEFGSPTAGALVEYVEAKRRAREAKRARTAAKKG